MYTKESVATLQAVLDQLQYTGLWPLALDHGHRRRRCRSSTSTLPRWYGIFTAVVLTGFVGMALVAGLPYVAGLAGPGLAASSPPSS